MRSSAPQRYWRRVSSHHHVYSRGYNNHSYTDPDCHSSNPLVVAPCVQREAVLPAAIFDVGHDFSLHASTLCPRALLRLPIYSTFPATTHSSSIRRRSEE